MYSRISPSQSSSPKKTMGSKVSPSQSSSPKETMGSKVSPSQSSSPKETMGSKVSPSKSSSPKGTMGSKISPSQSSSLKGTMGSKSKVSPSQSFGCYCFSFGPVESSKLQVIPESRSPCSSWASSFSVTPTGVKFIAHFAGRDPDCLSVSPANLNLLSATIS